MTRPVPAVPSWIHDALVYQVYPRSFADADGDGLGDIRGVVEKVPYLSALGVDAVWLSPFYPSALADGGYDVDDHRDVDPRLGTLADLDELITALHAAGIRLIVDIVPNHSSDRHPWFRQALAAAPGSPERERYVFRDGQGPHGDEPPSDWQSHFDGSAWTRVPDGQWYLHLFAQEQPDFNWEHPDVRADFLRTLKFWADRGVDGFRVDVAHMLLKDLVPPLRSRPNADPQAIPEDGSDPLYDRDGVHEIYREWRALFDQYVPPRQAVAEVWVPPNRRSLYARPTELGQAFNFDLLEARWDAEEFRRIIAANLHQAELDGASSTWVLSNHDVVRHRSRYGLPQETELRSGGGGSLDAWLMADGRHPVEDRALGGRRARAGIQLVWALPGSTYVFQGEELGLPEVADLPRDCLQDPIWRRSEGMRKGRDGCRVPLPWTDGGDLGFGPHPHLPQPAWFADFAVSAQEDDPGSFLTFYRDGIRLRRELRGLSFEWVEAPAGVLAFRRGEWLVLCNMSGAPVARPAGELVLSSSPCDGTDVPSDVTVWLRTAD